MRTFMSGLAVILSTALLAGCTGAISSEARNNDIAAAEGLSYYLPMRHVKVVVERVGKSKKQKKLRATVGRLQTKLNAAKTTMGTSRQTVSTKERELTILIRAKADESTVNTKASELLTAQVTFDLDREEFERVKAKKEEVEAKLEEARSSPAGSFVETANIQVLNYSPDTSKRFIAKLNHSQFRNDGWIIETSSAGLLSSANVTVSGQLDEIAAKIAETVLVLTGALPPGLPAPSANGNAGAALSDSDKSLKRLCADTRSFRFEKIIDPSRDEEWQAINEILGKEVICSEYRLNVIKPENVVPKDVKAINVSGLAYRREIPYRIELKRCVIASNCTVDTAVPTDTVVVDLPNGAPIETIPYRTDAFADNVINVKFKNGMLTKVDAKNPSGALALASTPLKVVNAATKSLGDLLTLRVKATGSQNTLLKNETKSLQDLVGRLRAQQAYDEALKSYLEGKTIPENKDSQGK